MKNVTAEQKIARWIEFADFMDNLPETKFNHGDWCRPDHTCKTTACVAGWGAIQYSPIVKEWLSKTFEYQKLQKEYTDTSFRNRERRDEISEKMEKIGSLVDKLENKFSWSKEGQRTLFLSYQAADKLFISGSSFWETREVTNKDVALVFRYMAANYPPKEKSGVLPERFNRERMVASLLPKPDVALIPNSAI
jgi:hypothetical protein